MEYKPLIVIIPAKTGCTLSLVCKAPVINPAIIPAAIPAKTARMGWPLRETKTEITAPNPKLPSVVKSGISNILKEIYIPIANKP